jgi:hypothetical protein
MFKNIPILTDRKTLLLIISVFLGYIITSTHQSPSSSRSFSWVAHLNRSMSVSRRKVSQLVPLLFWDVWPRGYSFPSSLHAQHKPINSHKHAHTQSTSTNPHTEEKHTVNFNTAIISSGFLLLLYNIRIRLIACKALQHFNTVRASYLFLK